MTEDTRPAATTMAAGALLMDAAVWVGAACWMELRFHQWLTGVLGTVEPDAAVALWSVRAHRAALAAEWHQRLPELRELPRAGFVEPTPEVSELIDTPTASTPTSAIVVSLAVLREFAAHYRAHQSVVTGPADGPTATALRRAVAETDADIEALGALRSP